MHSLVTLLLISSLAQTAPAASVPGHNSEARIGPDDTITIQAMSAEEISRVWRVGESGELNLPMIGRVQVAGMTAGELEAVLAERLKRYVLDPQVTVFVSESRSHPVIVSGAVQNPGTYQLDRPTTLFDVLAKAGGPKDAGPTVSVTRESRAGMIDYPGTVVDTAAGSSTATLDLHSVMQGHGPAADFPIEQRDRIAVSPTKDTKTVHIAGEVNKPGSVELVTRDRISLIQLVALAGGLSHTAAPGKTTIVRNESGEPKVVGRINLKRILSGSDKDIELGPGDIVIVPSSTLTAFLQSTSMSVITAGVYVLARF